MDCIRVMSEAAEGPQVNCKRCANILRSNKLVFCMQGYTHTAKGLQMTVAENPSKEKRNQFEFFPRKNPWNEFSWLTMEGRSPRGSATATWTKASPRPALRLFLGADNLQKDCKGKSLTLKYFFHLWKYYIKQSRVQWLTLLLGMLVFPPH